MTIATPPARSGGSTADIVVSVILLVVAWAVVAVSGLIGLFLLVFLDDCPPSTCNAGAAWASVLGWIGGALVVAVVGSVFSGWRGSRRRRMWFVALPTCAVASVLGFVGLAGFFAAV